MNGCWLLVADQTSCCRKGVVVRKKWPERSSERSSERSYQKGVVRKELSRKELARNVSERFVQGK